MGWPGERMRHSQSARGIKTKYTVPKLPKQPPKSARKVVNITILIEDKDFAKLISEAESVTTAKKGLQDALGQYGIITFTKHNNVKIIIDSDGVSRLSNDMNDYYEGFDERVDVRDDWQVLSFIWDRLGNNIKAPVYRGLGTSIWELHYDEVNFKPKITRRYGLQEDQV